MHRLDPELRKLDAMLEAQNRASRAGGHAEDIYMSLPCMNSYNLIYGNEEASKHASVIINKFIFIEEYCRHQCL